MRRTCWLRRFKQGEIVFDSTSRQHRGAGLLSRVLPSGVQGARPGFGQFVAYNSVSTAAGAVAGSMATTTLLGVFFVDSTPIMWLFKDLAPAVASVILASTFADSDRKPKRTLCGAVAAVQASFACDLAAASLLPVDALVALCALTSMVRCAGMLALGASRATLIRNMSIDGNVGDLTTRVSGATVLAYTVGGAIGLAISAAVTNPAMQAGGVVALSGVACVTAYHAARGVIMRVVDELTLLWLLSTWRHSGGVPSPVSNETGEGPEGVLLCPDVASVRMTAAFYAIAVKCAQTGPVAVRCVWRSKSVIGVLVPDTCDDVSLCAAVLAALEMGAQEDSCWPTEHDLERAAAALECMRNAGWSTEPVVGMAVGRRISIA